MRMLEINCYAKKYLLNICITFDKYDNYTKQINKSKKCI